MAGAKSEEKTWLNYRVFPLAGQFFDTISSAQEVASKEWHTFVSQNFCEDLTNYLPFIMHSKIMKHNSFPEWVLNPCFMNWVNIEFHFV
jgi:hypothetical protein